MKKNLCCSCVFAKWRLTKNATPHKSGEGMCTWEIEVPLPYSITRRVACIDGKHAAFKGGMINRLYEKPRAGECAVYQEKKD